MAAAVIDLFVGQLTDQNGIPIPDGSLVQLVVSTAGNASFDTPSGSSFVGPSADDVVAVSFALNRLTANNTAGADSRPITLNYETPTNGKQILPGMPMLLRWYPSRGVMDQSPNIGDRFGDFRTDTSGVDGSTIAWITPGDGNRESLTFATQSIGGSQPNSAGNASKIVPVPEPTAVGLIAVGLFAAFGRRRRA